MLVIRRRPGESLLLGDDVEIEILEISGAQVKLGIRAPRSVGVARKEIHMVSRQNRVSAVPIAGPDVERMVEKLKNPPSSPISAL
jgi:carbon storage regulator